VFYICQYKQVIKRIALVANSSFAMYRFRAEIIKIMLAQGYCVIVIAPDDGSTQKLIKLGCEYIHFKMQKKGSNPLQDLFTLRSLLKLYRKLAPDVIFHYTIKPNIYGSIAAKIAGIPSIAVITGLGYTFIQQSLTSTIAKYLYRVSLRYPFRVWFLNSDDIHEFQNRNIIQNNKALLLPSEGVNCKEFYPISSKPKNKFIFLLIARMLWDKGIGEYIEAAKIIKSKYSDVEFQLVGSTEVQNPSAISIEQVMNWNQHGIINYLGVVDDVKSIIARADCIVLPSYREGISRVLLESALMEKPLIATNVPGCKEVVEHTVNGFLCNVKDNKHLAEVMKIMLLLPLKQRTQMGKLGRKKVIREFDIKIVVDRYFKTIAELDNSVNELRDDA
jgi:glycosyltransferase involved in cell wall biosynthesis